MDTKQNKIQFVKEFLPKLVSKEIAKIYALSKKDFGKCDTENKIKLDKINQV
jgi:hypothetical protein